MKCEHPSLYAALLVGVLVNVLLRSQTAYWCRAGAAAALVCAPVLAAVGALFAVSWRQGATPLLRLLFALLLAGTSVLELLRLWNPHAAVISRCRHPAGTLPAGAAANSLPAPRLGYFADGLRGVVPALHRHGGNAVVGLSAAASPTCKTPR